MRRLVFTFVCCTAQATYRAVYAGIFPWVSLSLVSPNTATALLSLYNAAQRDANRRTMPAICTGPLCVVTCFHYSRSCRKPRCVHVAHVSSADCIYSFSITSKAVCWFRKIYPFIFLCNSLALNSILYISPVLFCLKEQLAHTSAYPEHSAIQINSHFHMLRIVRYHCIWMPSLAIGCMKMYKFSSWRRKWWGTDTA